MINAIIIEDEYDIRKGLITSINMITNDINILCECDSVQSAIQSTKKLKPDLVFLDINLGDGTAFDFLEKTNHLGYKTIITTSHDEYAIKALREGAIDYLLKPIDLDELEEAINKTLIQIKPTNYKKQSDKLILSLHDSFQIINFSKLMYCKSDKGYTTFYLSNGKFHLASKVLKDFVEQLSNPNFFRIHQSYIVNLDFVDRYDKSGFCILEDGTSLPVSSRKKDLFISKLLEY